jgi:hypothetical protein
MRLFRQPVIGDWDAAMANVGTELRLRYRLSEPSERLLRTA